MITHQNITMYLNIKPAHHPADGSFESFIVIIGAKYLSALITPRQDMIISVWKIHSHRSCHGIMLPVIVSMSTFK